MSAPLISVFVLVVSILLLIFWLRVTCRRILRQRFERDYAAEVATAHQWEFLALRQALGESPEEIADCQRVLATLQRDYEALTYLLRHAATLHVGRYARRERLLILDFHLLHLWIRLKRWVGWKRGHKDLLEMTEILRYFANVMGQRLVTFSATPRRSERI
ncbi:MAG: hypothetical protein ACE5H2_09005 [Terriglobia bacterium]